MGFEVSYLGLPTSLTFIFRLLNMGKCDPPASSFYCLPCQHLLFLYVHEPKQINCSLARVVYHSNRKETKGAEKLTWDPGDQYRSPDIVGLRGQSSNRCSLPNTDKDTNQNCSLLGTCPRSSWHILFHYILIFYCGRAQVLCWILGREVGPHAT